MHQLTYGDIKAAADRIAGRVRPVALAPVKVARLRSNGADVRQAGSEYAEALAALTTHAYAPEEGERTAVVLCGANTDPTDLAAGGPGAN
ncbi:threonine dehydratase [Kitasatospora sp. GP82]|nr:threonine dehydratase [Kitasatospora sp. GP82]